MIGALIGAGTSLVSNIAGAIGSARANKKANQLIQQEKEKNKAWYDKNYNADFTQRADTQKLLNDTREMLNQRYAQTAATNVVTGGTDESAAMQKAIANQTLANTMSNANAAAAAQKDRIEQAYMSNDATLSDRQILQQQQKAQNIANAAAEAGRIGGSIVGSVLDKDE